VSLEEAREKATDARKLRRDGGDPIQAKRAAEDAPRIEAAKAITFGGGSQALHQSQSSRLEKCQARRPMGDDFARHRPEREADQERLLQDYP
jgi:hypothetical protein